MKKRLFKNKYKIENKNKQGNLETVIITLQPYMVSV